MVRFRGATHHEVGGPQWAWSTTPTFRAASPTSVPPTPNERRLSSSFDRRHHQDGRLTEEELAERIERVNAATTFGDLDASMANLPRLLPSLAPPTATVQERAPGAARQGFYRALFAYLVINLFLIGIWAFSGRGAFWPIWVVLGWGLGMAFYVFRVFGPQDGRSR